jgi:hypothetical protein
MSGNYAIGLCSEQSLIPFPDTIQSENLVLYKSNPSSSAEISQLYTGSLFAVEEIMEFLNLNSLDLLNELTEQNLFRYWKITEQLFIKGFWRHRQEVVPALP